MLVLAQIVILCLEKPGTGTGTGTVPGLYRDCQGVLPVRWGDRTPGRIGCGARAALQSVLVPDCHSSGFRQLASPRWKK